MRPDRSEGWAARKFRLKKRFYRARSDGDEYGQDRAAEELNVMNNIDRARAQQTEEPFEHGKNCGCEGACPS